MNFLTFCIDFVINLNELANLGPQEADFDHELSEEQKHKKLYFYP